MVLHKLHIEYDQISPLKISTSSVSEYKLGNLGVEEK